MPNQKKLKKLKEELKKDLLFIKDVFAMLSSNVQVKGEVNDEEYLENSSYPQIETENSKGVKRSLPHNENENLKRAKSITELEEKLQKVKADKKFNLKSKLAKKSIASKLHKKIKKKDRMNKLKVKTSIHNHLKQDTEEKKISVQRSKPVFNNDGKIVFSKFDFAYAGKNDKALTNKKKNDPKTLLENLKKQQESFRKLEEGQDGDRVQEIKEKLAWKNTLQKAEGQKVKDDPILLKKSIKKIEQKKKQSKKQWDTRIQTVEQKIEKRQKKRRENITNKKKEKKSKMIKTAVKRGRVVI